MRLLNTTSLTLHEFLEGDIPSYAILSHRWEKQEVTLQDIRDGLAPQMAGWSKIAGCCAQAALDGWDCASIDTCCIDKTSSAELSEAINSMFYWYQLAQICYAYLSDVKSASEDPYQEFSDFRRSQWFQRGWTLQELLAPYYVDFVDREWNWIGSKATLDGVVREVTKVSDLGDYKDASIAQKMSWAAYRKTTRIKDMSYCLLGLFDVHMPPLYGERENAFLRLQLEIIKKTDDDSIFAWEGESSFGLLALSPMVLARTSKVVTAQWDTLRPAHSMSNKGLQVYFPLLPGGKMKYLSENPQYFAPLNCTRSGNDETDNQKMVSLVMFQSSGDGK